MSLNIHKRIVPALFRSLIRRGHKMFGGYLGYNRGIIVSNIAITHGGGNDFRKLIDCLTIEELKIMKLDENLIQRTKDILTLSAEDLREYMVKAWGLSVEECQNNDWWFDVEGIREKCPVWARAQIEGHYIDGPDFIKWAQQWLMQEVRVNINIKYIEELRAAAKEKERKALEEQYTEAQRYGMCDAGYL